MTTTCAPIICSIKGCDKAAAVASGKLSFCKEHGIMLGLLTKPLDLKTRLTFVG